jgi:hypothetical protein
MEDGGDLNKRNNLRSPQLNAAISEFRAWSLDHLKAMDIAQKVQSQLFHYTDANGLAGIIKNQEIWLTSIFHLNDPSELAYGIEIARAVLGAEWEAGDQIIKVFCKRLESVLLGDLGNTFGFYVASFSRSSDDLGQWRAYADNGRGFAIGLAPHLFHPEDSADRKPNEMVFVAEVTYDRANAEKQQREAIERAIAIVRREVKDGAIQSESEARGFLKGMSVELAVPILWNSITTKHAAYQNETETRLLIINELAKLAPHIETRARGSNLIPFIRSPMPIRAAGSITEIVIGPSASAPEAKDALKSLLLSQGLPQEIPLRLSDIPYRAQL